MHVYSQVVCASPPVTKPVYEEVWFIAAVAAAGVLVITILMVVATVICFKCCWKCGSDNGKIYGESHRVFTVNQSTFIASTHSHESAECVQSERRVQWVQ